jgi:uncharacterized protein YdbL (DUF1318 family)
MRKRYAAGMISVLGISFLLACITVNIYFPEATVRQTAEEIVNDIQKKAAERAGEESIKESSVWPQAVFFSLVPVAYAQQETTVSNPTIRALKESIADHLASMMPFFTAGNVGLTNKGLVEIRDETGLDLKAKAALRKLVKEDNSDRMELYAEVAKALNIEASQIERIQKIFAENWIKTAGKGWWIQQEDGDWIQKEK